MTGAQQVVDGKLVDVDDDDVTDVTDDEIIDDDVSDDDSDDDDGEGEKKLEPWMEEEGEQSLSDVPVATHIKVKQKLKRRLTDKDSELEKLRQENLTLKAGIPQPGPMKKIKRPVENDFDTVTEYEEALEVYDQKMLDIRLEASNQRLSMQRAQANARAQLDGAVDEHYSRAAKLVQDNGIDTEVYKAADLIVREAIETLVPGKGDITTDHLISVLGEGSEKVMFYLGRNKDALNEFKSLFLEDKSGLKATMFLGQQRERLLKSKARSSNARPPAKDVKGDNTPTSANANALLKRRKAAVKNGNWQKAYDIKKQAKAAGIDVSSW